jgi:AcrR family transcriptional regulator
MPTRTDVSTEERLLRAAEELFAAHGVEGVSLRTIMNAAGANVASVHYHFGSKEALLEAVVRRRLDDVTGARNSVLDELADAEQVTARDLARALVAPVVQVAEDGGRSWVKLIGGLLRSNDPGLAPIAQTFFERNARFVELMQRHDPEVSTETLSFRLTQAMGVALHVVGEGANIQSLMAGGGTPWSQDEVAAQLLAVVTSVLAGPPDESRS